MATRIQGYRDAITALPAGRRRRCKTALECPSNAYSGCQYVQSLGDSFCIPKAAVQEMDCSQQQTSCQGDASCAAMCGAGWSCVRGVCASAGAPAPNNPGAGRPQTPCTGDWQCSAYQCPAVGGVAQEPYCAGGSCGCRAAAGGGSGETGGPGGGGGGGGGGAGTTVDCNQNRTSCTSDANCANCTGDGAPNGWYCPTGSSPRYCTPRPNGGGGGGGNPQRPCTGHAECVAANGAGWTCVEGTCQGPGGGGPDDPPPGCVECGEGQACGEGQRCDPDTGCCVHDDGTPVVPPTESCTNDGDCPAARPRCANGRCVPSLASGPGGVPRPEFPEIEVPAAPEPVQLGTACTDDAGCPDGFVCLNGRCAPDPNIETELPDPGDVGTGDPLPTFTPPTPEEVRADPGYSFRLNEGLKAIGARLNAAGVLGPQSGDVMRAFTKYAQDYASGEYSKVYQRKVDEYNRSTEKNKEELRRKADDYNRRVNSVLTENRLSAENFQRMLAAVGSNRAEALAEFGMNMQSFTAMLQRIKAELDMNDQQWGQWLAVWITEQDTLRGLLGL